MTHEISAGPHPNLILVRIYDEISHDDLGMNAELGLGSGKPVYLLVDASEMAFGVPENFLDAARQSPYSHPDVKHTAIVLKPGPILALARVVPKLTRQQNKVSTYTSAQDALAYLMTLIRQAGL